jgi:hypothetical protein
MVCRAGEGFEDEPAGGPGGAAGVEAGDLPVGAGGAAGLAFDQGEHQQRQADSVEQAVDALVVLQEHRGRPRAGP